jgi:hypothetical protein
MIANHEIATAMTNGTANLFQSFHIHNKPGNAPQPHAFNIVFVT